MLSLCERLGIWNWNNFHNCFRVSILLKVEFICSTENRGWIVNWNFSSRGDEIMLNLIDTVLGFLHVNPTASSGVRAKRCLSRRVVSEVHSRSVRSSVDNIVMRLVDVLNERPHTLNGWSAGNQIWTWIIYLFWELVSEVRNNVNCTQTNSHYFDASNDAFNE